MLHRPLLLKTILIESKTNKTKTFIRTKVSGINISYEHLQRIKSMEYARFSIWCSYVLLIMTNKTRVRSLSGSRISLLKWALANWHLKIVKSYLRNTARQIVCYVIGVDVQRTYWHAGNGGMMSQFQSQIGLAVVGTHMAM